jgi:hypothetical protein
MRSIRAFFSLALLGLALVWPVKVEAAERRESTRLRLCNPSGEIRAERTPKGLRIRYLDPSGHPDQIDFTLPGWEVRSADATGGRACVLLEKPPGSSTDQGISMTEDRLSAKDEVIVYGGAFQDKVILRRGGRGIDLGDERITIQDSEVVSPKGKTSPGKSETK